MRRGYCSQGIRRVRAYRHLPDLYMERFEPVLPYAEISCDEPLHQVIAQHCTEIAAADGIVFMHPSWWGLRPCDPERMG